ncbi:MAG: hypothetical protein RAO92_00210 [Candidatus Euphemobacter frigidus]|nr:hypothetical protein [Candidatus Euphemobacter frigidus]MDP8274801.1 hypothetical protein [Candidatus Euphemobacter frigidus]
MSWEWDKASFKTKLKTGKTGIKKLQDEWAWQPVTLGPGKSYGGHQAGALFEDEEYPCGFCRGQGERPRGTKCPVCRGTGTLIVDPPVVTCAFCRGRGEEKPRSNVTCNACKGKGVHHVEAPVEICPKCRGTGKEPTNKLVCGTCRGKGVVTVREETRSHDLKASDRNPWSGGGESFLSAKVERERPVGTASGSERDVLEVVKELGRADRVAVSRHASPPISSTYAEQLCDSLVRKGLLLREGRYYILASHAGNPPDRKL